MVGPPTDTLPHHGLPSTGKGGIAKTLPPQQQKSDPTLLTQQAQAKHLQESVNNAKMAKPVPVNVEQWLAEAEKDDSNHKKEEFVMEHAEGWFHAESNRTEQMRLAVIHCERICRSVDELFERGLNPDGRWTNDTDVCPCPNLPGTQTANPMLEFPPHDQQYFMNGVYNPLESKLRPTAVPSHELDHELGSVWLRLVDFAASPHAVKLYSDTIENNVHCGKVLPGSLDNGYLAEAMQAISMRPKLCRQMFYCWDTSRSVYIARIFKSGTWMRVEVDDYVPVGPPAIGDTAPNAPICCRSDKFPYVLWPSLVEKAYAKVHTFRKSHATVSPEDHGGWEALDGGGRTEEALADLTGGVAGRFRTSDVTADRLFIYIHELQRDTLFVCRVNEPMCDGNGVALNPYYPNVVNRAVVWEGRTYVQMFCGAPGIFDGGLQDSSVPWSLINSEEFPERPMQGYFWISAQDFHAYYDTIFECRLVNSGDVSIQNMPPPRLPGFLPMLLPGMPMMPGPFPGMAPGMMPRMPMPGVFPGMVPPPGMAMPPPGSMMPMPPMRGGAASMTSPMGQHAEDGHMHQPWFEWVHANPGMVCRYNAPEFCISVPDQVCPCEIVCVLEQMDKRLSQRTQERRPSAAVLLKVYEQVDGNSYSADLVCRSNWIPCRDSMVAWVANRGGQYRVITEMPRGTLIDKMIFRCYTPRPNVMVTAAASMQRHLLVPPRGPPHGVKMTFVGCIRPERYTTGQLALNEPEHLDLEHDCLRKPEFDSVNVVSELVQEVKQDCSVM